MAHHLPPPLSQLNFSARIDHLSLSHVRRQPTWPTTGRVAWKSSSHDTEFTIHDPSGEDLALLALVYPKGLLTGLQVSVDIKPKKSPSDREHLKTLQTIMSEYVAKGLSPLSTKGVNRAFPGIYEACAQGGYDLIPPNRPLRGVKDQSLYGEKCDGVRVEPCIMMGPDEERAANVAALRMRLEVRLGACGLLYHGLERLCNLEGFKFHTKLVPYFQHAYDTRPRKWHWTEAEVRRLLSIMDKHRVPTTKPFWESVGVSENGLGSFLKRERARERERIHSYRHMAMNGRIGMALRRLQVNFAATEFACAFTDEAKAAREANTSMQASSSPVICSSPEDAGDMEFDQFLIALGLGR